MEEDKKVLEELKKKEKIYKMVILIEIVILVIVLLFIAWVYYNVSRVPDGGGLYGTELEIATFNNRFDKYIGKKIGGVQVNALIQAVNTNNNTVGAEDEERHVFLEGDSAETEVDGDYRAKAITGKRYNVEVTEYSKNRFIKRIKITEVVVE